jgi:hypothetical protein
MDSITIIGQHDSTLGVYCGVLKPPKQQTTSAVSGKKKVTQKAPPANVSRETVASAVRVLEAKIQVGFRDVLDCLCGCFVVVVCVIFYVI